MSLHAASLMWFGNSFHSLGADSRKDLSPYIAVWLLDTLKSEYAQIGAFSLVYMFRLERIDTVVLFMSVLWMYETRSGTVIWNVLEASAAGTKLVLYAPFYVYVLQQNTQKKVWIIFTTNTWINHWKQPIEKPS